MLKDNPAANFKFVKCVEKHEILYNFTLADYGKKDLQDGAWRDVATEMNTTGMDVYTMQLFILNNPFNIVYFQYLRIIFRYYIVMYL